MTRSSRPAVSLGRMALAATLILAMVGCQSTRTAGGGRSWGPLGARTTNKSLATQHTVAKPRWYIPWRRHSVESQVAAVEAQPMAVHPQATAAATPTSKPVVRLMMPTTSRSKPTSPAAVNDAVSLAPVLPPQEVPAGQPISAVDDSVSARMNSRMNDIFQTGAELPGESVPGEAVPGEVNVAFADEETAVPKDSVDVKVDEVPPVSDPNTTTSMMPITEALEEGTVNAAGVPVIIEPSVVGVGPDRRGLYDNLIGRLGAVWYDNAINSEWGFMGTGETTHQWGNSNWFSHLGVVGTAFDSHTGTGVSVGFSRLAKIVGTKVERPWILGFAYDGYYDSGLFGTDNEVYVDQLRGLIGYAICPCWDMGVWAAGGLSSRDVTLPQNMTFGPTARYRASIADRVAGYTAWHLGQTGIFTITSVGWQDNASGNFFVESDCYIPLTGAVNFYVGGGYSDNLGGSSDLGMGLEFTWGRTCVARAIARHCKGKSLPKVGMLPTDTMAHGSFCRQIDPCCVRYRGGWANDTYRSAFRVESPARLTRRIGLEAIPPTAGGQGEIPPVDPQGEPVCPKPANPQEVLVPRKTDRPTRPSRLSEYEKTHGSRNEAECRQPVMPASTTNVLRTAI